MLERHVQIGQDHPIGHQRDEFVDVRIGIDIVQPNPGRQLAQGARQLGDVSA
jgi:hypothetical protein